MARFRDVAVMCSYGHQDFYRVLGRDPIKRPMTEIERALFARCLIECWEAKMRVDPMVSLMGAPSEQD